MLVSKVQFVVEDKVAKLSGSFGFADLAATEAKILAKLAQINAIDVTEISGFDSALVVLLCKMAALEINCVVPEQIKPLLSLYCVEDLLENKK